MALIIGSLKGELSAEEVIVRKMVATKVVEKRYTLSSWVETKWRGLLIDYRENLLSAPQLSTVKKQLQAHIGHQVDTYPPPFRSPGIVNATWIATSLARAFFEVLADQVC